MLIEEFSIHKNTELFEAIIILKIPILFLYNQDSYFLSAAFIAPTVLSHCISPPSTGNYFCIIVNYITAAIVLLCYNSGSILRYNSSSVSRYSSGKYAIDECEVCRTRWNRMT